MDKEPKKQGLGVPLTLEFPVETKDVELPPKPTEKERIINPNSPLAEMTEEELIEFNKKDDKRYWD